MRFAFVSALGRGPFLPATNQGITELSVVFFRPNQTLLFFNRSISNSVVLYGFLSIGFDTTSETLVGHLNVGKDSFAEGEPGSSAGQFYLSSPPTQLIDSFTGQPVDSGNGVVVDGPVLNMSMSGAGSVQVTWATNFTGYFLEHTTNLPPAGWTLSTNSVAVTGGRFSVTLDAISENRFFRLRKP
jgi:hypothetical protein